MIYPKIKLDTPELQEIWILEQRLTTAGKYNEKELSKMKELTELILTINYQQNGSIPASAVQGEEKW